MPAFKLDENLSATLKVPLVADGHDVTTVNDESLRGAADARVAAACRAESRCLITADEGFAQILRYPPDAYAGIIVLRHPRPTLRHWRSWCDR
jgi:predicted nuclease of predicted toxin-antitoxin system